MQSARDRLRYAENYLVLARQQLEGDKPAEAYASLRRALGLAPGNVEALRAISRLLYNANDFAEAEAYLQRWRAVKDDDPEACLLLGNIYLSTERAGLAMEHYREARRLGDDSPDLLFNQGLAAYLASDMEGAEQAFRQALALAPDFARALDGLGCIARNRGQLEAAIALFRRAAAADPTLVEALEHLAQVYLEQEEPARAREALAQVSSKQPLSARGWYLLGVAQMRCKNYLGAINPLRHAVSQEPAHEDALSALAYCYHHTGQSEQALAAAEQALARNPDSPDALLVRGQALWAQGRLDEAHRDLVRARQCDPDSEEIATALHALLREER